MNGVNDRWVTPTDRSADRGPPVSHDGLNVLKFTNDHLPWIDRYYLISNTWGVRMEHKDLQNLLFR